jgi:chromosome segregation ATPase
VGWKLLKLGRFTGLFLLCAVLFWGLSPPLYSLDGETDGNGTSSGNELERLIWISERLGELNTTLRNELDGSRKSSEELRFMLTKSKTELDILRVELELLRVTSTALLNRAEISQTELKMLQEALTKAGSSLTSLEQSFAAYRQTAELRIVSLERSRNGYRIAFFTAAGLAIGGIIMGAVGLGR